jgi:hypothetical protein
VSQEQVIGVQTELSACKTEQLETLKKAESSSVKAEFKSYSSVVQNSRPPAPVISLQALTTVVKNGVAEEDRSGNFLIFGLSEFKSLTMEIHEPSVTPKNRKNSKFGQIFHF